MCQSICHHAMQNEVQSPYSGMTVCLLSPSCSLFWSSLEIQIQLSHINPAVLPLTWQAMMCRGTLSSFASDHLILISDPTIYIHLWSSHSRVSFSMKPFLVPVSSLHNIHSTEFCYTYMFTCLFFPTRWQIPRGKSLCITNLKISKAWHNTWHTWHIEECYTDAVFSDRTIISFNTQNNKLCAVYSRFYIMYYCDWKSTSSKLITWYCFLLSSMIGKWRRNTYFSLEFFLKFSFAEQ